MILGICNLKHIESDEVAVETLLIHIIFILISVILIRGWIFYFINYFLFHAY